MPRKSYKRVLLKLSGEVFGGEKGIGVDPDVVHDVANQIADVVRSSSHSNWWWKLL
jgi:uridylate kinase